MNLKPAYKPITQLRYHCVPACLSMIFDRRKIPHGTQEEIGYELGLVLPAESVQEFKKVRTGNKPISGYGTQVNKSRYSLSHFFKKHRLPLTETYYPPKKIEDYAAFIRQHLGQSNDMIVCFNNEALFGSGNWGHVCLIEGIDKNSITLIDPSPSAPKKRNVTLTDLIEAIEKHGKDCRAGFWTISITPPIKKLTQHCILK